MKTNGLTYKAFLNDQEYWGEDAYYDDVMVIVDGDEISPDDDPQEISDTASVVIKSGYVMSHHKMPDGTLLTGFFKGWQKKQSFTHKIVIIPAVKEKEFNEIMKKHGFKIL